MDLNLEQLPVYLHALHLSSVVLDAARTVRASSDMILIQIRMLCCGLHVLRKELACMPACTVLRKM